MTKIVNPSQFIKNESESFFRAFKLGAIAEKANMIFSDKSYLERHTKKYMFAQLLSVFTQILSILFAVTFAAKIFQNLFPFIENEIVIYALASVILVFLETAKRFTADDFFTTFHKSKSTNYSTNWFSAAGLLLLTIASIYFSVEGAKDYAVQATDQSEQTNTKYDSLIAAEKTALNDFKKSVSWKGKIDVYNKTIKETIASHQKNIADFEAKRNADLCVNFKETNEESNKMFYISLANELIILICLFFIYTYLFNVWLERSNTNDPVNNDPVGTTNPYNEPVVMPFASPKTGFQFSSPNEPVHDKNTTTNPYNEPVHGKNGNSFGIDICEHCGEKFQRKTHNQRFCKEECRIASWEKRTGKTFKKGKSNGFNAIMVQLVLLVAMYPQTNNPFFFGLYILFHGIVSIQIIAWAYSKIKKGRGVKFPKNFNPTKETTKETLKEYYKTKSK